MSMLAGAFAHIFAILLAVPVAIVVTVILMWCFRLSPIQRIVFPGADECRDLEVLTQELTHLKGREHKPYEMQALAQLGHGLLIRNGLLAIAVAVIFWVVLVSAHALLMAA